MKKLKNLHKKIYLYCSEEKKITWYDIPKAASTSIKSALYEIAPDLKTVGAPWWDKKIRLKAFEQNIQNSFVFCFVRNPWDRAVSNYFMFKRLNDDRAKNLRKLFLEKYNEEYLKEIYSFDLFCQNLQKIMECESAKLFPCNHLISQHQFLYTEPDFIGKLENIQKDFNYIFNTLGIKPPKLEHKNKTDHKNYQHYYNAETKKIVNKIYEEDIDLFKYKF